MADEIKQHEKNGNFVQFYRIICKLYQSLPAKTPRLFKSLCLFASIWMAIMLLWRPIKFSWITQAKQGHHSKSYKIPLTTTDMLIF